MLSDQPGRFIDAIPYWHLAASLGHYRAKSSTILSENGKGEPFDSAEDAFRFHLARAKNEQADSQLAISIALMLGVGVDEDEDESLLWNLRAVGNRHIDAHYILGRDLVEGHSRPGNFREGEMLLTTAAGQDT